ncbi:MAG TPA: MTH938/NDUFAF3 family protein [Bauldia sp.]|nr:MTH938/NDUFAF3 family protein [Bauldia sp.]
MAGIVVRAAHYPRRAPIDAYGNGGFRFAGMSHRGSLLCLPSGIYGWDPTGRIDRQTLIKVFEESDAIEVLLVGTGRDVAPLDADLAAALRERGIVADAMSTGAAVRTFNVLLAEDRAVAAALLAVD